MPPSVACHVGPTWQTTLCLPLHHLSDARRAYCDALLAVREITDSSHPAKQSGEGQLWLPCRA